MNSDDLGIAVKLGILHPWLMGSTTGTALLIDMVSSFPSVMPFVVVVVLLIVEFAVRYPTCNQLYLSLLLLQTDTFSQLFNLNTQKSPHYLGKRWKNFRADFLHALPTFV